MNNQMRYRKTNHRMSNTRYSQSVITIALNYLHSKQAKNTLKLFVAGWLVLFITISNVSNANALSSVDMNVESEINDRIPDLYYSIQIGVFRNHIDDEIFSEFEPLVKKNLHNGLVRYSTGVFESEFEAKGRLSNVIHKGITDAFIIAYYKDERISLSDALELEKEIDMDTHIRGWISSASADTISSSRGINIMEIAEERPDSLIADSFYTIILGVFDEFLDGDQTEDYAPVLMRGLPDGSIRYTAGLFLSRPLAEDLLRRTIEDGFDEATVAKFAFEDHPTILEEYGSLFYDARVAIAADTTLYAAEAEWVEDTADVPEEELEELEEYEELEEPFHEVADTVHVDTTALVAAEPDSILTDTVDVADYMKESIADLQLNFEAISDSIYADSVLSSRIVVTNAGSDVLPIGARIDFQYSNLNITNLYCSDTSGNLCRDISIADAIDRRGIDLPIMEVGDYYELWVDFETDAVDGLAEFSLDIALPPNTVDPDLSNNRSEEVFYVASLPVTEPIVEETEATEPEQPVVTLQEQPSGFPFLITIDGEPLMVDESALDREDHYRLIAHKDLHTSIEIRVDHREKTPFLNITAPRAAVRGQPIFFHGYTNYSDWIERYELRIFDRYTPSTGNPLALVSPVDETGTLFRWTGMLPQDIDAVNFVLRVYDRNGNFDETLPRELAIVDRRRPDSNVQRDTRDSRIGYGENRRSIANIQVNGGAVTVFGDELNAGSNVLVNGRPIPVDKNGRFVARQLKSPGNHLISVSVDDPVNGFIFQNREIYMPRRDWFQLGVADFTAGLGSVSGPVSLVTGNNTARYRGDEFVEGRLAFYLKGDLTNRTQITASADTREQPVSQLFTNFTERDPLALLRRLDSNYSYPIYGDDGILVDDAPTQGKFHVRLERDDSRLMWGSFRTPVAGTDLVHFNRGLYGAELHHRGLSTTSFGERRTSLDAFAADPGTVGSREEFRATGGSLYYLRHQDVLLGSERVFIEVRDRESGLVLESMTLQPYQDYELNALQGRIVLSRPLSSIQETQGMVRTGAVSGNPVYLVAHYEYTPSLVRIDNFTMGGRVSQWFGDHIQVGLTGYSQQGVQMEQDIYGVDATVRYRPGTFVRAEYANSEGRGAPVWSSIDGGFGFSEISSSAELNSNADAQRVEVGVSLADFGNGNNNGNLAAYIQQRGDGFSAPGQLNTEQITQGGVQAKLPVTSRLAFTAKGDIMEGSRSGESRALEAGAEVYLTRRIYVQGGARNEYRETSIMGGNSERLSETGSRTDAAGVIGYQSLGEDGAKGPFNIYAIFQGTIDKDDTRRSNDRYGFGGGLRLSDRVTVSGEATDGDGGWGGKAQTELSFSDRTIIYLNYLMDPDRTDQGIRGRSGNFTTGGRIRYSESTSVFMERRQEISEIGPSGLIHAFGLDFEPSVRWSYGVKLEAGTLSDATFGDVDRKAASLFAGYTSDRFRWGGSLEYRSDDSSERGQRDSWLTRNSLGLQISDGWRILGRANVAMSDGGEGRVMDADYTELVAGLAYRPSFHNRMNALLRYSYLYDLASPDQLGPRLELNPFAQKSHVFSVDGIVKVTRKISIGGKIGHRRGELRDRTVDDSDWFGSSAWLYIARGDIHIVNRWDFIAEYRWLTVEEANDVREGYLVGLYRQIGGNLRLGVGYNFTDYSDDLTDLSFRSEGWFVNLIGLF